MVHLWAQDAELFVLAICLWWQRQTKCLLIRHHHHAGAFVFGRMASALRRCKGMKGLCNACCFYQMETFCLAQMIPLSNYGQTANVFIHFLDIQTLSGKSYHSCNRYCCGVYYLICWHNEPDVIQSESIGAVLPGMHAAMQVKMAVGHSAMQMRLIDCSACFVCRPASTEYIWPGVCAGAWHY